VRRASASIKSSVSEEMRMLKGLDFAAMEAL
jgi:hypothetical protein